MEERVGLLYTNTILLVAVKRSRAHGAQKKEKKKKPSELSSDPTRAHIASEEKNAAETLFLCVTTDDSNDDVWRGFYFYFLRDNE